MGLVPSTFSILRYKNFQKLYWAGLTSEMGSFITETGLVLMIYHLSNENKAYLGIGRAIFLVALTIGGLIGGPIGEKLNRKKVLIFCEVFRIPIVLWLFMQQTVFSIILAQGFIAFFTGIFNPSRQALINEVVPQTEIKSANSLFSSTMAILHLGGPLVGAFMFSLNKSITGILALDFITYAMGIFLLISLRYDKKEEARSEAREDFMTSFKSGFKILGVRHDIRAICINSTVTGICIGILIPLLLPFTKEYLGGDEKQYGVLLAIFGFGGVFGGILAQKLSRKYQSGKLSVASVMIEPIVMSVWTSISNFYLSSFVIFIWGIVVFVRLTSNLNYVSETVETEFLSRVHSHLNLAFVVPNILGGIFIGIFGNIIETRQTLYITSVIFFILIYSRLKTQSIQELIAGKKRIIERKDLSI